MNKSELIKEVAKKAGLTQVNVALVIDSLIAVVQEAVRDGLTVKIIGFGMWYRFFRKECIRKNPKTGEPVTIKEHYTPMFKAGKDFKDLLKES